MIVDELKNFRKKLMQYTVYRKRQIMNHEKLTRKESDDLAVIYDEISISAGKYAPLVKEYTDLETIPTSAGLQDVWNWAFSFEENTIVVSALNNCLQATSRTIGKLESDIEMGIRDKETGYSIALPSKIITEPRKAFIAHGGKSEAREKLCRFLFALGVTPLIIEEEPKEGRSVNEQVQYYSEQADCAIILGTADDKELKDGKLYPRRNVYIEIGRFQEKFSNRIIYLLEEGASFPSNISEKLYTRFAQESMDEAFVTVVKELKAFGMINAVKPQ